MTVFCRSRKALLAGWPDRLMYSRARAAAMKSHTTVNARFNAANEDSTNPKGGPHIHDSSLKHVAEAPEERVDRSFGLILRFTAGPEEQGLPGGVLNRIVVAVIQNLQYVDQSQDRRNQDHGIADESNARTDEQRAAGTERFENA